MRPDRATIAVPPFPPGIPWVGEEPPPAERITARGPLLVQFIDFAQLNSVRALPYASAWHERYSPLGLTVVGVNSPRFPFGAEPASVAAGLRRLGVEHPVAVDAEYRLWHDYGCDGWPSLFLWGRGGVLRWFHFGEGEYEATELAIQEEIRAGDGERELPSPLVPIRPTDAPGARVVPPTPEAFPGGEAGRPLAAEDPPMEVSYEAAGAYATADGKGFVEVAVDGAAAERIEVDAPGLYTLVETPDHRPGRIVVSAGGEARIWSVSFAPGLVARSRP
jgi:hypothetical protein